MRPTLALLVTATLALLPSSSSSSAASPPPPPPSSEGGIFEVPLLAAVAGLETSPLPAVTQRHRQRRAVQQEQDGQQWVLSDMNANTEQTPTTDEGENGEFEEPLDWAHPEELRREAEEERALWRALLLETLAARSAGRGGGGKGGGEGEEEKRRREEKVRELFGELLRDDEEVRLGFLWSRSEGGGLTSFRKQVAEKTKEIEVRLFPFSPLSHGQDADPPVSPVPHYHLIPVATLSLVERSAPCVFPLPPVPPSRTSSTHTPLLGSSNGRRPSTLSARAPRRTGKRVGEATGDSARGGLCRAAWRGGG